MDGNEHAVTGGVRRWVEGLVSCRTCRRVEKVGGDGASGCWSLGGDGGHGAAGMVAGDEESFPGESRSTAGGSSGDFGWGAGDEEMKERIKGRGESESAVGGWNREVVKLIGGGSGCRWCEWVVGSASVKDGGCGGFREGLWSGSKVVWGWRENGVREVGRS
ncbi:glycine-rich protein 5-like [Malania oleifera]|uniref:glycine-rich protein 5-like n=1 Tax=Malania oleifera TaxID=397392 RepID=UPI0025ADF2A8|nr:glycine-rich protein 5-like [Malania oleifera]